MAVASKGIIAGSDPTNPEIGYAQGRRIRQMFAQGEKVFDTDLQSPVDTLIDPAHVTNTFSGTTLNVANITHTLLGTADAATDKYSGAVCTGNDKVILIPRNATQFAKVIPSTGTVTYFGTANSAVNKYMGGVYIGNGKLIAIPFRATQFAYIDTVPTTPTVTLFGTAMTLPTNGDMAGLHWGGSYMGNDTILAYVAQVFKARVVTSASTASRAVAQFGTANIGILNADDRSLSTGGTCIGQGMCVNFPYNGTLLHIFDLPGGTHRSTLSGASRYSCGGLFLGTDSILTLPYKSTRTFSRVRLRSSSSSSVDISSAILPSTMDNGHAGAVFISADRDALLVPCSYEKLRVFYDTAGTAWNLADVGTYQDTATDKYMGAAYAGNGNIILAPQNATQIMKVSLGSGYPNISEAALLSTWFNKF